MSFGEITVNCGINRSISFRTWNRRVLEHNSVAPEVESFWHVSVSDCTRRSKDFASMPTYVPASLRVSDAESCDSHSGESVITGSSPLSLTRPLVMELQSAARV